LYLTERPKTHELTIKKEKGMGHRIPLQQFNQKKKKPESQNEN